MAKNETSKKAATDAKEPTVGIKREQYQKSKSASGGASLNNGDVVANGIAGMEVSTIVEIAVKMGVAKPAKGETPAEDLSTKYAHLNVGMQRMNLGNRLRGRIAKINTLNEKALTQAKAGDDEKALAKAEKAKSGEDQFAAVISPFRKAADKQAAEAQKAKDVAAKEKAQKAEPKAKADEKGKKAA